MDLDRLAKPYLKNINPYRPGKPIEQLQRERGIQGPIAKLASNENPYPPLEAIKRAVMDALGNTNRYPESGAPELTKKLARYHAVDVQEVFVANGTNEILDLLVRAYVAANENVVFSALSFVIYKLICMQNGVAFVETAASKYTHDLVAMADAIDDKTKMVFVCNPNNPTGTYNTATDVQQFMTRVPDHTLVVMDEAYYDFVDAEDYPDSVELRNRYENLIVLRTFSKFYSLAGVRVGYAIADPRVTDILNRVRQPFNVNRLAQSAGVAAMDCREELAPIVAETVRERSSMREAMLKLGCTCPPTQTNFLFVVMDRDADEVCQALEGEGIIVRPMAGWGAPNAFRVNTGTPDENRRFVETFQAILTK